ncbi:MAG: ATPase, T2SS/T4P/T4SS family [Vicinamibacterales bacterium]
MLPDTLPPADTHAGHDSSTPDAAPHKGPRKLPTLGELLVNDGVITPRQLELALERQRTARQHRKLGQILIEERFTSEQRIHETVKAHGSEYPFGGLLVLLDLLTPEQLDECLRYQKSHHGRRIGEIALLKEFVAERQLLLALSYHFDKAYIEPDFTLIDVSLLKKVSVPYLKSKEAIPVFTDGKVATVVTPDPTRNDLVKDFSQMLKMPVELAVGPKEAILQAIADFEHFHRPSRAGAEPGEDNVVAIVDYLFTRAIRDRASDIHIEPMSNRVRIRYRIDGELVHRTDVPLYLAPKIASRVKVLCNADLAERRRHQGGRILYKHGDESVDMRVSIYVTIHGENIVIRLLHKATGVLPIEKLGMLPALLQRYKDSVLEVPTGVVLFTGPTGSGKTTSLYSSINYSNKPGVKIITAEDPVEYLVDGLVQCSIDPAAGRDFEKTLREIVRQDPNVIVVGEIRDRTTASIAIEAALTGHKVFATFHTEDSIGSLIRLLDMDIETFLISSTVVCVVAQRLARRICPDCKVTYEPTAYEMRTLELNPEDVKRHTFYKGVGCHKCNKTGYRGRVGLYELLMINGSIREMVLEKRSAHEIRHHALKAVNLYGLQEDGIAKALLGWTTLEQVIRHAPRVTEQRSLDDILAFATKQPD